MLYARLAQLVRAPALQAGGHRFESYTEHQKGLRITFHKYEVYDSRIKQE